MATLIALFFYTSLTIIFLHFIFKFRTTIINRHRRLPPGPKPWPIIGNLPHLGVKPHQSLAMLARTHGPLMHLRLGFVDVVVAASASIAAQFLKTHDANFSNRPPNSGAKHIAYNYKDLVFAPYGERWRLMRKICAVHMFSVKALDDFGHVREEEVSIMAKALATAGKNPVKLGQFLNLCTINILGRVMLGKRVFGEGEKAKADEFKAMAMEVMELAGVFNIGDFIPPLEWLDLQGIASKMKKLHIRLDTFLTAILKEYTSSSDIVSKPNHMDLLSVLISLKDDDVDGNGGKITDTEIKALLLNMFVAGTDTSSSTIEWALSELLRHPKILARAKEELDAVVGPARLVTESDMSRLTYLQAVVKETFRLHPATPLSLPRISAESCEINGYHIPKGSTLLVNIWAIGRDPNSWSDPLEFKPERFLPGGEKSKVDVKGNDFEIIPFGAGRRICTGMRLGIRMVQLVTATLVHAFDWDLPEDQSDKELDMEEAYGLALQRAKPLMVHPRPRLSPYVFST